MSILSDLFNQYNRLTNDLWGQNNRLSKLKKRKSQIQDIINNINSVANKNSDDVNDKIKAAARKMDSGIEYSGKEYMLDRIFSGNNETNANNDSCLSSAINSLRQELNNVERQISEVQSEKNYTSYQANNVKAKIKSEQNKTN